MEYMIRISITLLPAGIDDFSKEISHLDIACAFPLDPANQNFYIFQGMSYAELRGYDGTAQPDDDSGWWSLVYDALTELKVNGIHRQGGEIFPGMLAIEPVAFDEIMELLIENFGASIKTIRLFGPRAETPEMFTNMGFIKNIVKLSSDGGHLTGGFLFENNPEYQGYYLGVKLDPKLYQTGKIKHDSVTFPSQGVYLEKGINLMSLRVLPREDKIFCNNGILFCFLRPGPGGKTVCHWEENTDYHILREQMKVGNLIFDWKDRLYKYPGRRAARLIAKTDL